MHVISIAQVHRLSVRVVVWLYAQSRMVRWFIRVVPFGDQLWAGSNYWALLKVIVYCTWTDKVRIKIVSLFNAPDTSETLCGILAAARIRIPKNLHGNTTCPSQFWIERLWSGVPVSLQIVHHLIMIMTRKQAVSEELWWFSVSSRIAANFLKDLDHALSFKLRSALYCPIIGSPCPLIGPVTALRKSSVKSQKHHEM